MNFNTDLKLTHCRSCGHTMTDGGTQVQHPKQKAAGKRAIRYITCWRPGCLLTGFTFSRAGYHLLDLTEYFVGAVVKRLDADKSQNQSDTK